MRKNLLLLVGLCLLCGAQAQKKQVVAYLSELHCGSSIVQVDSCAGALCDLIPERPAPALGRVGWAEMPGNLPERGYICFSHDRLPSDSTLRNYTFCFDPVRYCSLWVAYPLHDCYVGESDRTNRFGLDPAFERSVQADIGKNAYYPQGGTKNSHSRGHQLPSADRTASTEDNLTTFYATNMTPQLQSLNGVRWAELEKDVREWRCADTLYVVTGAYFDPARAPQAAYDRKGQGKACPVPSHYYKVLLRSKSGGSGRPVWELPASELQCIGFWFDHDNPVSWQVGKCVRTIAEIERITGFSFFVNIPQAPKQMVDLTLWPGIE